MATSRRRLVEGLGACGNLGLSVVIYTMREFAKKKSLKCPLQGCWCFVLLQSELTCGSAATPGGPGRLFLLPVLGPLQADSQRFFQT